MTARVPQATLVAAWQRGLIRPLLLDSNQEAMSGWLGRTKEARNKLIVINKSRQIGGSYWICVEVVIFCIVHPHAQVKYAAQTAKQVRKILRPHFKAIFETCPVDYRPKYHSQDGEYRFPNGSVLTVAGCDRENAETLRGQHAHLAVVDEGGAIKDLEYVVNDILIPQTLNTRGNVVIISSPAKKSGHAFKQFCDLAESNGALLEKTIYDNPRITEEEIAELCKAAGGPESTTWKREYLAQHVTDEESAVIPEATREQLLAQTIVLSHEYDLSYRPIAFDTYVWVDPGWSPDATGILFAIWDFLNARFIVEDEFVMRKMSTPMLASVIHAKKDALWGKGHKTYMNVADIDHRLMHDLSTLHHLDFIPAQKDNLDEGINALRMSVSGQRFPMWTHPRCKALRRQLENVTWNKARTKFDRSAVDFHYDLISAAIYGRRSLATSHNPNKGVLPFSRGHGLLVEAEDHHASKASKVLRKLFKK